MEHEASGEPNPQLPSSSEPKASAREKVGKVFRRAREAVPTHRIPEVKERVVEFAKDPEVQRRAAVAAANFVNSERGTELVMKSRASRLGAEAESGPHRGLLYHGAKTVVEMIPGVIWGYGIGDAVTLFEAIRGKEIAGRKLDNVDRAISVVASLIPFVPATPFREAARNIRIRLEDNVAKKQEAKQQQLPPANP